MSFAEKIKGLLTRPNQSETAGDEAPWYFTYGSRALGVVGSFFAILFGVWNVVISMLTINIICCVSGIVQIAIGFGIMALEVPGCFFCIDYVNEVANMVDKRPVWNRAALYCGVSLVPIIMCPGLASIFSCGLIFGTGVIYGMMSLGKKASREDMAAAATATSPTQLPPDGNQMPVGTDQNITLMEDPDVWRPT